MKHNSKTSRWVGHLQLKYLDTDDFFKRKSVVDDIQASLTGNTIEHSTSERKNKPYLLQEDEEQESEEANDDADVNK